jgi:hypothetical protein
MDTPLRLAALLSGAALAAAAQGQQNAAEPEPLYQVEIIVFANTEASPAEESFPAQAALAPAPQPGYGPLPLEEFDFEAAQALEIPPADTAASASEAGSAPATEPGGSAPGTEPGGGVQGTEPAGGTQATEPAGGVQGTGPATAGANAPGTQTPGVAPPEPPPEPLIGPRGFRMLGADDFELDDTYARLERLDAYRPLLHRAWIQPALTEDQAKTISMVDLGTLNPQGGISLYASRYLHLNVDLTYRPTGAQRAAFATATATAPARNGAAAPGSPTEGTGSPTEGNASPAEGNGFDANGPNPIGTGGRNGGTGGPNRGTGGPNGGTAGPFATYGAGRIDQVSLGPVLTMKASRRVSTGDLLYFDHPYFGLLVMITRYEPEPETRAVGDGVAPTP